MKKNRVLVMVLAVCFAAAGISFAAQHEGGAMGAAGEGCSYCGMSLEKFAHSMVVIKYDDGTKVKTCSTHCAALDLAVQMDKTPEMIKVGDYNDKTHINAENAFWVIGGSQPGVMSKNAKWAFAGKEAAEAFIKENGGTLANFDEVMQATYVDLYADTKMIRDKRKKMKSMPMK